MNEPRNIDQARVNANAYARAKEAMKNGDFVWWFHGDGMITLDSWKAPKEGKRNYTRYTIDLNAETCTCPAFEHHKVCKHLIATILHVQAIEEEEAQEEARCEEWERLYGSAEDEVHGCDPYARY